MNPLVKILGTLAHLLPLRERKVALIRQRVVLQVGKQWAILDLGMLPDEQLSTK